MEKLGKVKWELWLPEQRRNQISAADVALRVGTARVSGVPADSMALRVPEHLAVPV